MHNRISALFFSVLLSSGIDVYNENTIRLHDIGNGAPPPTISPSFGAWNLKTSLHEFTIVGGTVLFPNTRKMVCFMQSISFGFQMDQFECFNP